MKNNFIFISSILILSIVGVFISSYLTVTHHKYKKDKDYKSTCRWFTEGKNDPCKSVSTSKYAEFKGIPLSIAGILMFSIIFIFEFFYFKFKKNIALYFILFLTIFAIIIYSYLTYLELYKINAICPLCVTTFIIIGIIFVLNLMQIKKLKQNPS